MTQANRDLECGGFVAVEWFERKYVNALAHLATELHYVDGFPERGEQVNVLSSSELTSVERAANTRYEIGILREDIRDALNEIKVAMRELDYLLSKASRVRVPRIVVKPEKRGDLCCNNQQGKHKADEWGDPLCNDLGMSNRGGLCEKHWKRWYRARTRDGIDTTKDFVPQRNEHGEEVPAWL